MLFLGKFLSKRSEIKHFGKICRIATFSHWFCVGHDDEFFSEDTRKNLKRALEEGKLTYSVSTAFIQGEARVGKTCLKSLILSLPYDEVSTSCIEAPCIAFSVDHYGHIDGKGWNLVTDDEMDEKIIAELQEYVARGNIPASEDDDVHQHTTIMVQENPMVVSSVNDSPMEFELQKVSADAVKIYGTSDMDDSQITDLQQEHETQQDQISLASALDLDMPASVHQEDDILEYCKRECHIDKFGYHRKWLYFIDSGGQIQFQKLLLAFLPCTSVFILVINLSKNLSDSSSTMMQLRNNQIAVDEHSLSVKDMLKQLLSAVASNAQQYKLVIRDSECIKHSGKKLSVLTVGTHRDKYEELRQDDKDIEEIVAKQKSLESILDSVQSICDIVYASPSSPFGQLNIIHEIDGRKAVDGHYDDVELDRIIQSLENQSYEVTVPLRWHYFGLVLRNKAKESEGVLMKSSCDEYGAMLRMEGSEVHSALQFFHTLKMLFYYHDSPAKDIVFVKLSSLIDIIKELMITVCRARSAVQNRPENLRKLAAKSYLSMKNLKSCESFMKIASFVKSIDFSSKLMGLFEHLKIAAKLPEGDFLMPALLPVRNVSDTEYIPNTLPLLFYFKTAVPMGLYCTVIVHLLSDSKGGKWRIISRNDCCSNYFTLQRNLFAGLGLNVTLVEQLNCIEVYCDKKDERQTVKEEIRKSIDEVMKEKLIDYETPEEVFYCPCMPRRDHIAKIVDKAFIICEDKDDTQEFGDSNEREEYWSWTMNKEEIKILNEQLLNCQLSNKRKTQCECIIITMMCT